MKTINIFLASSSELKFDREQFEIYINRKNKMWIQKGIFLRLDIWEDFLDVVSQTRLQDEYNKVIKDGDLFVMLFAKNVGKFTNEEFETAFGQFKVTNRPAILVYFKDVSLSIATINQDDMMSLWAFQKRLKEIGHFYTAFTTIDGLLHHFNHQLDLLVEKEIIELSNEINSEAVDLTSYNSTIGDHNSNINIQQGNGNHIRKPQ
ncbi:hypothetical protein EGI22_14970 [Lacihabitans sp. LS3-19]|uniref:hypothetical protein n=1 Tax=Lacihabitans sp. LS3-19 TaxID=2487335 RepID=UPI0020CD27E4|nr:hypothetical protein [Lacihabitans sp. LS3-19]MCP9769217.1 hypothetical protein [Lacihabitans sp. LS3-19]